MDVADHTKRSNRFGLEANFELGWEQPSIPCFKSEETYRHSRPPQSRHNLSRLRSSSSDFLHDTRSIHTQGWKDPAPAVSRSSGLRRLQSSASWGTSPVGHVPRLNIPTHADDVLFGTLPEKSQHNLSSLFVDLTNQAITMPHGQRRRSLSKDRSPKVCSSSSQAVKRRRIEPADSSIEEIDLRDVDSESDLARVLERQRATTVKQQQLQADKPMKLARVTCVVCMEEMTNMTATHCGKHRVPRSLPV